MNLLPIFALLVLVVLIWIFIFCLGQIAELIQRDENSFQSISQKWMWFIVLIVLGPIGAILYNWNRPK